MAIPTRPGPVSGPDAPHPRGDRRLGHAARGCLLLTLLLTLSGCELIVDFDRNKIEKPAAPSLDNSSKDAGVVGTGGTQDDDDAGSEGRTATDPGEDAGT